VNDKEAGYMIGVLLGIDYRELTERIKTDPVVYPLVKCLKEQILANFQLKQSIMNFHSIYSTGYGEENDKEK
jgi:hypothetical protein